MFNFRCYSLPIFICSTSGVIHHLSLYVQLQVLFTTYIYMFNFRCYSPPIFICSTSGVIHYLSLYVQLQVLFTTYLYMFNFRCYSLPIFICSTSGVTASGIVCFLPVAMNTASDVIHYLFYMFNLVWYLPL